MNNQFSSDSKRPTDGGNELRSWIDRILVGLVLLVVSYLGYELGDFQRKIGATNEALTHLSDWQENFELSRKERARFVDKYLDDHETRIRRLEDEHRQRKGY